MDPTFGLDPTCAVLMWWGAFAGSHILLSSTPVRSRLVARIGEGPFAGAYSLIALVFFSLLVWAYLTNKHAGPWLWTVAMTEPLRWVVYLVMGTALVLIMCGVVQPSPALIGQKSAGEPAGILLITRHPVFMGWGLGGLVHLLPNGTAADLAFFGGFALFAVVGSAHQDRRKLAAGVPGYEEFCARTPFLPFTGGRTLEGLRGLPKTGFAAGIVLTLVVRFFHASLF